MSYKDIFKDIKNNSIKTAYLFYGEEEYIKDQALFQLEEKILQPGFRDLNMQVFDGGETTSDEIINACETLPFMGEKRLVVVKDFSMLKSGGRRTSGEEEEMKRMIQYITRIPPSTCLLFFCRGDIDKRKGLVNAVKKNGGIIHFGILDDRELMKWIGSTCKRYEKKIGAQEIQFLIQFTGRKLEDVQNEILKLVDYTGARKVITREDIDKVVTKTLEHNIFQLVDSLGVRDAHRGITILHQMLQDGEYPLRILTMIARQFRILFQVKLLSAKGYSVKAVSEKLGLHSYAVSKSVGQSGNFTKDQLQEALRMCLEVDQNIKTGQMKDRLAIEMLICKLADAS